MQSFPMPPGATAEKLWSEKEAFRQKTHRLAESVERSLNNSSQPAANIMIMAYSRLCELLADYFADTSCNPPEGA